MPRVHDQGEGGRGLVVVVGELEVSAAMGARRGDDEKGKGGGEEQGR